MKRAIGFTFIALVAVAVIGGIVWSNSAATARDKIFVFVDPVPFDCNEDIVSIAPFDENGVSVPVIDVSEPFDCTLRFHIRNDNDFDVSVTEVTLPNYGIGFASSPLATAIDSTPITYADEWELDAVVPFGDHFMLPANDYYTLEVQLEQSPGSCMSGGGMAWSEQGPILETSIYGISEAIESPTSPFGVIGTATQGCPRD
jgi:hypothetical protein